MEFLDLIDTFAARDASVSALYAREGFRLVELGANYNKHQRDRLDRKLYETVKFLHQIYTGKRPRHHLIEAMTTSDFPLLFGVVIDRQTLGSYREWPATWRTIARVATVPDFRSVERGYDPFGGDTRLDVVHELEEYKAAFIDEINPFTYKVQKYGRRMPFSWEVMVNDVQNRLKDAPIRFGRAAVRSEQYFATSLYVSSTGPSASVYTVGNKNQIITANGAASNNPALSITGLQDGFTVLNRQVDAQGNPILIEAVVLEVPPALEIIANNILNATQLELGASTDTQRLVTNNWMKNRVTLVVNPYLSLINTTNGNTAWYLHAAASTGRPLLEIGFLAGYETPQIFMKSPNAVRVGGGASLIDPMQGDFDNDGIDYKVRHVFGGSIVDPIASAASEGDGT